MATKYKIGGTATWDNTDDTIWSTSSGGANNTTHPVAGDEQRQKHEQHENANADAPLEQQLLRPRAQLPDARHPGLPKSPCGLNASTIASNAKLRTIEYCVQHSLLVVGRYTAANENTRP